MKAGTKKIRRAGLGTLLKYIILLALIIIVLFPLIWLFSGSVKLEKEILQYPPTLFGTEITWKNFIRIFDTIPMGNYLKNTVIFAGFSTFFCSFIRLNGRICHCKTAL